MKPILLLNISESNNEWNKSVLDMAQEARERRYKGPKPSRRPAGENAVEAGQVTAIPSVKKTECL